MNFMKKLFGGLGLLERDQKPSPTVVRWSDDPLGMTREESALKGIESLAGLLISEDILEANGHPNASVCFLVEPYYAAAGVNEDSGDFIGVYFREVEFLDQTYPLAGRELLKMLLQPVSDGTVFARWNDIDLSRAGESLHGVGMMAENERVRTGRAWPLALGEIPEQDEDDAGIASFIFLRPPGGDWHIWRRFAPIKEDGEFVVIDGFHEETHIKIYPELDESSSWRFKIYHLPEGRLRIESEPGVSVHSGDAQRRGPRPVERDLR